MKTYNQFATEAKIAREELIEANVLSRGLSRVGTRTALKLGGKTAARLLPGVGQVYGAYSAIDAARRGDWTGAGLGALSMVPGPVGWAAIAADVARGEPQAAQAKPQPQPKQQEPYSQPTSSADSSAAPTPAPAASNVLAKKAGVEGTLDKATGKWTAKKWDEPGRKRYETLRGTKTPQNNNLSQNLNTAAAELSAKPLAVPSPIAAAGQNYGQVAFQNPPKKVIPKMSV